MSGKKDMKNMREKWLADKRQLVVDIYEKSFESVEEYFKLTFAHFKIGLRWIFLSVVVGIVAGAFSSVFAQVLSAVTQYRTDNPKIMIFLPLGGLVIVALYRGLKMGNDKGANVLFMAVHDEYQDVPAMLAPAIFAATAITHLFGGSSGREGAALQMGGSLGNTVGKIFRQKERNRKVLVMSGMSAAFAAIFGTPLAAAIFPLEMVNVGMMQYGALVPCAFASIIAYRFAHTLGINPEAFIIHHIPKWDPVVMTKIVILGILCAWVSILFLVVIRYTHSMYDHLIENPYLRIFIGGLVVLGITFLIGDMTYSGGGSNLIELAICEEEVKPWTFLVKMILTGLTLGCGYKGGEIVPSFTVGATFGCLFGHIAGISPSLCAACGMIAVFCGVTNCPMTSLLIGFELFGFSGAKYLLIVVALAYMLSGYVSLYKEQVVLYSKYHVKFIKDANELDPLWKKEEK